MDRLVL
jgi:hypothetical protein